MNIRREIRKTQLKISFFRLINMIISVILVHVFWKESFWLEFKNAVENVDFFIIFGFIFIAIIWFVCIYGVIAYMKLFLSSLKLIIFPEKSRLYKHFIDDEIIIGRTEEVKRDYIYNFGDLYISEKIYYNEKDIESLIKCDDITGITKRTISNRSTFFYEFEITGKDGYKHVVEFSKYWDKELEERGETLSRITSLPVKKEQKSSSDKHYS